ncbi:MAG: protein YgfX [Cycloclasticus sp.]
MKKSIPTFDVSLKVSNKLKFTVAVTFCLAMASFWINDLNRWIQVILTVILLLFVGPVYRSIISYKRICKIHLLSDGCWELVDFKGKSEIYILKNSSAILGSFFFLHFQNKSKNINLVLAQDSITDDESRKLRLTMRVYNSQLMKAKV